MGPLIERLGASAREICSTVLLTSFCWGAGGVAAEPLDKSHAAIQLSLVGNLQLVDSEHSIRALRLSVLRGDNRDVKGFDMTLATNLTRGRQKGFQVGPVNEVLGDFVGAQLGWLLNFIDGRLEGAQLAGLISKVNRGEGAQAAMVICEAKHFRGLQVGAITMAEDMHGLQLGGLNFNENGFLPVFPLFNWGGPPPWNRWWSRR